MGIFCIASPAVGQNDGIFQGLGIGGKAALAVIKNLCGTEPPVACTCQPEDGEDSDEDDIDNVEVLKAPLPSCIPKTCICPDGSEQPLPTLPNRILKKVSRVLEKISAKIQSKLTKVCENGVDPTVCECDNVLLKELRFPVDNEVDIARCRPTRCSCAGQGPDGEDQWVVINPAKILFSAFINNVCSLKSGSTSPSEKFQSLLGGADGNSIPTSCSCTNGTEISPPFSVRQMKYCKPDSCTCPAENDETEPRTVDIDFGKLKQKAKLIKKKFNKINKLCPNNTPPTSCKCLGDAENSITPPFYDPLDVLECLPSSCSCADGSEIKTNIGGRNTLLKRIASICEDDKLPESCTCEDDTNITPSAISSEVLEGRVPSGETFRKVKRRLKKAFKRCKPISCSCPNGVTKAITIFGCKEGEFPKCPNGDAPALSITQLPDPFS